MPHGFLLFLFFCFLHGTVVNRFRYNGLLDTFVFCLMRTKYPSGTFVNKQMKKKNEITAPAALMLTNHLSCFFFLSDKCVDAVDIKWLLWSAWEFYRTCVHSSCAEVVQAVKGRRSVLRNVFSH